MHYFDVHQNNAIAGRSRDETSSCCVEFTKEIATFFWRRGCIQGVTKTIKPVEAESFLRQTLEVVVPRWDHRVAEGKGGGEPADCLVSVSDAQLSKVNPGSVPAFDSYFSVEKVTSRC